MNWKSRTAFLLLLPMYWWMVCVVPPIGAVEFVTHMAEEGEHCLSFCQHPSSFIDPPHASATVQTPSDELIPRFDSLSHSLRAPPSLIDC